MFSLDGFNFGILISWSAVLYHKDTNCNSRWNEEKRPSSSWPKSYSGEDIQQRSKMRKWDRSRPAGLCPWSGSWSLSWQLQITPPPPPYSLYGFIKNAFGCVPFSLWIWICGHYWLLLCLKMCHVFLESQWFVIIQRRLTIHTFSHHLYFRKSNSLKSPF